MFLKCLKFPDARPAPLFSAVAAIIESTVLRPSGDACCSRRDMALLLIPSSGWIIETIFSLANFLTVVISLLLRQPCINSIMQSEEVTLCS